MASSDIQAVSQAAKLFRCFLCNADFPSLGACVAHMLVHGNQLQLVQKQDKNSDTVSNVSCSSQHPAETNLTNKVPGSKSPVSISSVPDLLSPSEKKTACASVQVEVGTDTLISNPAISSQNAVLITQGTSEIVRSVPDQTAGNGTKTFITQETPGTVLTIPDSASSSQDGSFSTQGTSEMVFLVKKPTTGSQAQTMIAINGSQAVSRVSGQTVKTKTAPLRSLLQLTPPVQLQHTTSQDKVAQSGPDVAEACQDESTQDVSTARIKIESGTGKTSGAQTKSFDLPAQRSKTAAVSDSQRILEEGKKSNSVETEVNRTESSVAKDGRRSKECVVNDGNLGRADERVKRINVKFDKGRASMVAVDKPYKCKLCRAQFSHASTLSVHKRRHSAGWKPYQCPKCEKMFSDQSNFRVHLRTHSKEKPFKCDICGHRANQAGDIRTHRRVHTGEMPFFCNMQGCEKQFRDASHFRRHMKQHEGYKPHVPCDFCGAMFYNNSAMLRHRRKHTGERRYMCSVCKSSFARLDTLQLHLRIHTGERPYQCGECQMSFADRSQCRRHIKKSDHSHSVINVVHNPSKFAAPVLAIKQEDKDLSLSSNGSVADSASVTKKPTILQVPLAITNGEDGETTYETIEIELPDSGICGDNSSEDITYQYGEMLITISRSAVNQLQEEKSEGRLAVAGAVAGVTESTAENSVENVPRVAEVVLEPTESKSDSAENGKLGWFMCQNCGTAFPSDEQFQEHLKTSCRESAAGLGDVSRAKDASMDVSVSQPVAESTLVLSQTAASQTVADSSSASDQSDVTDHQNPLSPQVSGTKRQTAAGAGAKRFFCGSCDEGFAQMAELRSHALRHTEFRPHQLSAGMQVLETKRQRSPRTGEKRFFCETCSAGFFHMAELRRHALKHTGEKPYQCRICGKRTRDPSNLKRHIRTHTGERPYGCQVCGKRFAQAGHLSSHQRLHSGERPFACDQCDARFVESNHLRHHLRVHAGIKPNVCDICGFAFIRRAELRRHKLVHSGIKQFKCTDCSAEFFRMDALKSHRLKHTKPAPKARLNCELCLQTFAKPGFLHRHMVTVHRKEGAQNKPDKPASGTRHTCSLCPQSFARPAFLQRHMYMVHNKGNSPLQRADKPDLENSVVADALCELAAGRRTLSTVSETEEHPPVVSGKASEVSTAGAAVPEVGSVDQSVSTPDKAAEVSFAVSVSDVGCLQVEEMTNSDQTVYSAERVNEETVDASQAEQIESLSNAGPVQGAGNTENGAVTIYDIPEGSVLLSDVDAGDCTRYVVINSAKESRPQVVSIVDPMKSSGVDLSALGSTSMSVGAMEVCSTIDVSQLSSSIIPTDQFVDSSVIGQIASQDTQLADGSGGNLDLTVQSLLSGQAQLESVSAVEVQTSEMKGAAGEQIVIKQEPPGKTATLGGQVVIKLEAPDSADVPPPLPTPLRTRSGRERKIKVKMSL